MGKATPDTSASPPSVLTARAARSSILKSFFTMVLVGLLLSVPALARGPLPPPAAQGRPGVPVLVDDASGQAMKPWHDALRRAQRRKGQARIAFYGASHTAADLWTGQLRRLLQDRFGDAGHGFVFPARWNIGYRHQDIVTSAKGWAVARHKQVNVDPTGDYGLAGLTMTSADPTDWAEVRSTADNEHGRKFSRLELWFRSAPDGGDLIVEVDGKRRVVATRGDGTAQVASWKLADTSHVVRMHPAGNGPVVLFGLNVDRTAPGVVVDQLGIPGMRADIHLRWHEPNWARMLTARKPDLVVLAYGTNEVADEAEPIEAYRDTWRKVLKRVRSAAPEAACLLVGPTDRLSKDLAGVKTTLPRTPAVIAAQKQVAAELGCAHWDAFAAMGGAGSMLAWQTAGLASVDDVHLTRNGYPWLAELLHYALLRDLGRPMRTAGVE